MKNCAETSGVVLGSAATSMAHGKRDTRLSAKKGSREFEVRSVGCAARQWSPTDPQDTRQTGSARASGSPSQGRGDRRLRPANFRERARPLRSGRARDRRAPAASGPFEFETAAGPLGGAAAVMRRGQARPPGPGVFLAAVGVTAEIRTRPSPWGGPPENRNPRSAPPGAAPAAAAAGGGRIDRTTAGTRRPFEKPPRRTYFSLAWLSEGTVEPFPLEYMLGPRRGAPRPPG